MHPRPGRLGRGNGKPIGMLQTRYTGTSVSATVSIALKEMARGKHLEIWSPVYKLQLNPTAHAVGFFRCAVGFFPTFNRRGETM
jgi:hypothetical protein